MKIVIFGLALIFSYYGFRRVWRDVRDGDIINDGAALIAIVLWTIFYSINN